MWKTFKTYCLPQFLIFFAGFGLIVMFSWKAAKAHHRIGGAFLLVLAVSLPLSLFTGTMYYLLDTRWGPRARRKAYERPPFAALRETGFTGYANGFLSEVNGYAALVRFDWKAGPDLISLRLFYDGKAATNLQDAEVRKALEKRMNGTLRELKGSLLLAPGSLIAHLPYNRKRTSFEKIRRQLESMADFLEAETLPRLSAETIRTDPVRFRN